MTAVSDAQAGIFWLRRPGMGTRRHSFIRSSEAVHICGEACSDRQGWVESAFCVAENMLQEHFGPAWPDWLSRDYYLGW